MKIRHPVGVFVIFLTLLLQARAATPVMRTWTSTDGRKIEASFVALDGAGVKVRMANGNTFTVPLDRLSAADQTFAKTQTARPVLRKPVIN